MKLNMGDVSSEPLPEGSYLLRVIDVDTRPTKDKPDNLNLIVSFEIIQPEEFASRKHTEFFSLTQQALWKLQLFLEAVTGKEWKEDDMELDEKELIGMFVRATMMHQTYNGRVNARVREFFPDL